MVTLRVIFTLRVMCTLRVMGTLRVMVTLRVIFRSHRHWGGNLQIPVAARPASLKTGIPVGLRYEDLVQLRSLRFHQKKQ